MRQRARVFAAAAAGVCPAGRATRALPLAIPVAYGRKRQRSTVPNQTSPTDDSFSWTVFIGVALAEFKNKFGCHSQTGDSRQSRRR